MKASRNEHTIAVSCHVSGRGYWTGQEVCVDILPAPMGTGIKLIRSDLHSLPSCSASVIHRSDAHLRTILQSGPARFEMIEHLMAALYSLEIDNSFVHINGEEFPGLDGSALPYVEALQHSGLIIQAKPRQRYVIQHPIRIESGPRWIEVTPSDNGLASFEYRLGFEGQTSIKDQSFKLSMTPDRFARDVAPARTFVTQQQAESLRAQGVASHVTYQDLMVFGKDGLIDNQFRLPEECARHKVLDMIGDLALAGIDLVGNFVSYRGGHNLNGQMAQHLHRLAVNENKTSQQRNAA